MSTPDPINEFVYDLDTHHPELTIALDRPAQPDGEWVIDIYTTEPTHIHIFNVQVVWRPAQGFGVYEPANDSYGSGPSIVFKTPDEASNWVRQAYQRWNATLPKPVLDAPYQVRAKYNGGDVALAVFFLLLGVVFVVYMAHDTLKAINT